MREGLFLEVDDVMPIYSHPSVWQRLGTEPVLSTGTDLEGIKVKVNGQEAYFSCRKYKIFYPDILIKTSRDEAWQLAMRIREMPIGDLHECFGKVTASEIMKLRYEEVKEKYDAWVKKKTVKEMTLEEIEDAIGCSIKIVNSKKK